MLYYVYRQERTTQLKGDYMRKGKIYCPVNGWDCPYYKNGECGIENPLEECDDFGYFWNADDDYICEDEERTAFENE